MCPRPCSRTTSSATSSSSCGASAGRTRSGRPREPLVCRAARRARPRPAHAALRAPEEQSLRPPGAGPASRRQAALAPGLLLLLRFARLHGASLAPARRLSRGRPLGHVHGKRSDEQRQGRATAQRHQWAPGPRGPRGGWTRQVTGLQTRRRMARRCRSGTSAAS